MNWVPIVTILVILNLTLSVIYLTDDDMSRGLRKWNRDLRLWHVLVLLLFIYGILLSYLWKGIGFLILAILMIPIKRWSPAARSKKE
jgi:hypothetical protein